MDENTNGTAASSPPSPSTPQEEADAIARRNATVAKATTRLEEIAGYLGLIDKAIVSAVSDMVALHPMGEAIDSFVRLEASAESAETQIKAIMGRMAYAREVSFPARLDAEETRTFTAAETGNRMTRTARVFVSIVSEKLADAYDWLRKNDLGPLIKETVNSSSLSAAAKAMMENGGEMPEDLFRVHMKDGVSITKGKKN